MSTGEKIARELLSQGMQREREAIKRERRTVRFICRACNGTGASRYYEYRDCDQCDGHGTIMSYVELS